MDAYQTLRVDRAGHVLRIGLARVAKRNAFNLQMLRELGEAYTAYEANEELRCAVLYAEGDHFTAGLDLAEVAPSVQAGGRLFPEGLVDPVGLFEPRRKKPVVIAVQGYCFTLGIELLLACDICVAAESTRFCQMEPRRGIAAFGGATLRFAKVAGWHNAMRYLLTADEFDAATAARIGLAQEVVAHGQQLEAAMAIAQRIAKQAPLAVRETLASCRMAVEESEAAANAALLPNARRLMQSEDAAEGVRSFVERREAIFNGR
jgi:enoyl-CoA hydratase/carnithine racemase